MKLSDYREHIVQDPAILVGKPVVKGTRIPAALVLGYLAANPDLDELFAAYPRLSIEDLKACLAYGQAAVERQRRRRVRPAESERSTPTR